ncbi:hypothetical protein ACIBCR_01240 [Micromonospora echinospora]|uniref:hypothetical protein n=1 Tax=Micromonospora echinospora TaxID=1877 RepID=UPI00379A05A4
MNVSVTDHSEQLALTGDDLSVYLLAVRREHIDDLDAAAAELDLPAPTVSAVVRRLTALRLLRPDGGQRLVPVNPEVSAAAVIAPVEQEIHQRRQMIHTVRQHIENFLPLYRSGRRLGDSEAAVEPLTSPAETAGVFRQAVESCRRELLGVHPPGFPDGGTTDGAGGHLALLDPGVTARLIYPHRVRVDLSAKQQVKRLIGAGTQVRTTNQSLKTVAVFDRRLAIIFGTGADSGGEALVVHSPGVVEFLCDLFDQFWQAASPYTATEVGYGDAADDIKMSIVRLLAEGMTDEMVARRLGMSLRACRRHIAELFRSLDSVSRFQAGVRAAATGLTVSN